jgi:hypothetical protein
LAAASSSRDTDRVSPQPDTAASSAEMLGNQVAASRGCVRGTARWLGDPFAPVLDEKEIDAVS